MITSMLPVHPLAKAPLPNHDYVHDTSASTCQNAFAQPRILCVWACRLGNCVFLEVLHTFSMRITMITSMLPVHPLAKAPLPNHDYVHATSASTCQNAFAQLRILCVWACRLGKCAFIEVLHTFSMHITMITSMLPVHPLARAPLPNHDYVHATSASTCQSTIAQP